MNTSVEFRKAQRDFQDAATRLLSACEMSQMTPEVKADWGSIMMAQYIAEHCVVRISGPRQIGHKTLAAQWFQRDPEKTILVAMSTKKGRPRMEVRNHGTDCRTPLPGFKYPSLEGWARSHRGVFLNRIIFSGPQDCLDKPGLLAAVAALDGHLSTAHVFTIIVIGS